MKDTNNIYKIILVVLLLGLVAAILILVPYIGFSWVVIALAGCYALLQLYNQCRNWWDGRQSIVAKRERLLRVLAGLMGLFLITGTALFLYAFQCEQEEHNSYLFVNAEYLLRSLICSLDLFMLDIDSNVLDEIKNHQYLKGFISVQAIFSFSCTIALLISLAYARVKAYYKLHKRTVIDKDHNHLYVFFDMNEPSRMLANSIRNKEGERAVIAIIEKSPVDDEDRGGWNSIVGMFTHREQTFADAEDLDARITFTETRLCEVDLDKLVEKDILDEINLKSLKGLISKLANNIPDAELHVFFLTDNEKENIRSMSILAEDETINKVNEKIKQCFYCHARRTGLNRVIEDVAVKRGLEVRIVDSAHLAIELLKADDKNHPVRLVEIDKDNPTTVKSEFNSLIIGFDEAGQDALRFLYEFGAFVDSKALPTKELRSPFHCQVIDKKMDELEGYYVAFSPSVLNSTNTDGSPLVELKKIDCQSKDFYELIAKDSFREKLNYVVIAVGNDELGMTCAIRLFNYVRLQRKDLSRFRIYVRSYCSDKEQYMKKIADHYNEGYNKDFKKQQKSEEEKDAYQPQSIIVPFGKNEEIYSYDMIIDERFIKEGKKFQEAYARMKNETELWDDRRKMLLGYREIVKNEFGEKSIREVPRGERELSLDDIRSLRRKESQDLANALHAGTKIFLLKQTKPKDYDWSSFMDKYFDADGITPLCEGKYDERRYSGLSPSENKAILNLARLEHLRWNASHEMLGYKQAGKELHGCNERTREHNCLRPWDELDPESQNVREKQGWEADYKSFDFSVVDTSLWLHKNNLL